VFPAADCSPGRAGDGQYGTNPQGDDAEDPQNLDSGEEADDEQNDAENDYLVPSRCAES
jgi:hypothetical protein